MGSRWMQEVWLELGEAGARLFLVPTCWERSVSGAPPAALVPSLCSPSVTRLGSAEQLLCARDHQPHPSISKLLPARLAAEAPCVALPAPHWAHRSSLLTGLTIPSAVFFFPPFLLLCATVSLCFLTADRMRCNLRPPGPTQNGESSRSVPGDGNEFVDVRYVGLCWRCCKKIGLFFKAGRWWCEVST